jgi:hypothetical protein
MPLKRYDILDTAFDSRLGRYYILNEGWILEVWDLLDEHRVTPMARIRFFAEKIDTKRIVERCYPHRHSNNFPSFLSLSQDDN